MIGRLFVATAAGCLLLASTAAAQIRIQGAYAAPAGPACMTEWTLPSLRSAGPLPAVAGLAETFSGGALERPMCLVGVVRPGGVYLDQTILAVARAPQGPVVQELERPAMAAYIPIAECWPATIGFDDVNGDSVPDILMMLECQDRNAEIYARPNAVYLSGGRGNDVRWVQDRARNQRLSQYDAYEALLAATRSDLGGQAMPAPAEPLPELPQTMPPPVSPPAPPAKPAPAEGPYVTLHGQVQDCDATGGSLACTVVFTDGRIRRITMRPDVGLVQGRTGVPAPEELAGKEVIVEGETDARGDLVRVHSMRLAQ
ncbi:hypothetical protein [Oceanidesulfovibrio marinus]|uniref:Uncharacterized protein n=1 Tax=Oceanidesulfovibrio marinus TaxID=370038 RepID=A0A6P1ZEI2_9BACT|nr:hypothetical protein [Oceanidesulfovibrio marinus]TVM32303.1 hypothetical protein DQK91_15595 [Oceanidesulfovibrio marinus]